MRVFSEQRIQEMLLWKPIKNTEWTIVLGIDGNTVEVYRKNWGKMHPSIQGFQKYLHGEPGTAPQVFEELQALFIEREKDYYWDREMKEIINEPG